MDTVCILSVGRIAGLLGASPQRIEQAADALGIQPALKLNGVAHYHETDIDRLADHLRRQRGTSQ